MAEQPPQKVRFLAAVPADRPVSEPMAKVPHYSKADVKSVVAAIAMIKEERDRRIAVRFASSVEAATEPAEGGDVVLAMEEPTVVPPRTAVSAVTFEPHASTGQTSPQTVCNKATIIPVSIAPSEDPEVLRYSFCKCEEAKWSDPHWIASPEHREKVKQEVPVDNRLYWCQELSEAVIRNNAMLYVAPFSRQDMWDTVGVNWQDYDVTSGWAKTQSKNIVTYLRHVAPLRNVINASNTPSLWIVAVG